ncbi:hypothetical protein CP533_4888 [Ophiocordyceps camponoti-saundersi (nom. inval.)]|nr:hypothetical protein CP533_4888 [Ophiocordyceps camponoti-saundersi (nom. inval.)]
MLRRAVHYRRLSQLPRRPEAEEALRQARPLIPTAFAARITRQLPGRKRLLLVSAVAVSAATFYLHNLETVPQTGRRRFKCIASRTLAYLYSDEYDLILRQIQSRGEWLLPDNDARMVIVRRIMERLIPVSGTDQKIKWRIHVIEGPHKIANAFILPGGKVFIHSHLFEACSSEDALAAVLGHELAHSSLEHQAEDASAVWASTLTIGSLFLAAGAVPGFIMFCFCGAFGGFYLRDLFLRLPWRRRHEAEADYVGLMMMAEACYDPRAAVGFWRKMEILQKDNKVDAFELFSTHPTNQNRLEKIKEWLPEAMQRYDQSGCASLSVFYRGVDAMTSSPYFRRAAHFPS